MIPHNPFVRLKRKVSRELSVLSFPLRKRRLSSKTIVACVFSVGERTTGQAIRSVEAQSTPVARIELIENVTPNSRALNTIFDVANDADYVLLVDADMILYRYCLKFLLSMARHDVLFCVGGLVDPVMGRIGHVKLQNMTLSQELGVRYRDVLGTDFDFLLQAQKENGKIVPMCGSGRRKVLGVHHSTYTAKELFKKMQIWRNKKGLDMRLLSSLVEKYKRSHNRVLLYGIMGLMIHDSKRSHGASAPSPATGLDNWELAERLLGPVGENDVYGFPQP